MTAWPEHTRLKALAALALSSGEGDTPSLGAFELEADSDVDLESRLVRLSRFEIVKGRFPSLDDRAAAGLMSRLKEILPPNEMLLFPLPPIPLPQPDVLPADGEHEEEPLKTPRTAPAV